MGKGIDNLRYWEMEVEDGVYLPDYDVEYPEDDPGKHIVGVKYDVISF